MPADDFVVVNRGRDEDTGTVRVFQDQAGAGNDPFQLPDISYVEVEIVSPNVATTANGTGGDAFPLAASSTTSILVSTVT